jgi:hypothetical protein
MSHKNEDTQLATIAVGPLSLPDYGTDVGGGYENVGQDDVTIGYLRIIQPLSPEVNGLPDQRVAGAKVGDILVSNTKEVFDGTKGLIIQPVATRHVFVEWKPERKGFVSMHELSDAVVQKSKATQKWAEYTTDAGNILADTFYMPSLIHRTSNLDAQSKSVPEPVVLAFSGGSIKCYRAIMDRLNPFKARVPIWAHRLLVTSYDDISKKTGKPYKNIRLKPLIDGNVVASLIDPKYTTIHTFGRELCKAYLSGTKKVEAPDHDGTTTDGGGDDTIPF